MGKKAHVTDFDKGHVPFFPRPVTSSSGGLGALPLGALRLGALPLGAFFSSDLRFDRRCFVLCGQVEKRSLRLFREG